MLQQTGKYNDLSKKLTDKLQKKIEEFGKIVRYRFDIEQENPDKTFYNGKTIFPGQYTLDPAVFTILDKDEDAPNKSKTKNIALIKETDDKGNPTSFIKIRVAAGMRGILRLDLENEEDRNKCMFLEMHPKLKGGDFSDPTKAHIFSRIDENAVATEQIRERSSRLKAMTVAGGMTKKELVDFADAMLWDSSQEESVLRNETEMLAENDPDFFNDLVSGKAVEYQAAVKQAINKGIITFDPVEYKFTWTGNKQTIQILSPSGTQNEVEKFSEWLQIGGEKANEIYKKIKSLIGVKEKVTS